MALKRQGYPILNSNAALQALKRNTWRCNDGLVDCADPDGSLRQGCSPARAQRYRLRALRLQPAHGDLVGFAGQPAGHFGGDQDIFIDFCHKDFCHRGHRERREKKKKERERDFLPVL